MMEVTKNIARPARAINLRHAQIIAEGSS